MRVSVSERHSGLLLYGIGDTFTFCMSATLVREGTQVYDGYWSQSAQSAIIITRSQAHERRCKNGQKPVKGGRLTITLRYQTKLRAVAWLRFGRQVFSCHLQFFCLEDGVRAQENARVAANVFKT